MPFKLDGQKVLITGATGGIGTSMVKMFSEQGAVVGLSGRDNDKLLELSKILPNTSFVFPCDLNNRNAVSNLFDEVETKMGVVDILICNAGITKDMLAVKMTDDDFESVLDINLTSTFVLNRSALKKMLRRRYGRIINISSISGVIGNPGQANYCASKSGVIGMSKALALEVASKNITVNCIAPGFIRTAMTDKLSQETQDNIASRIPMKRFGDPDDVAYLALFLASKEAGYITGQVMSVNGGLAM